MQANLMLLLAAAIWGLGFVAQRLGMEHLGPYSFNGLFSCVLGRLGRELAAGFIRLGSFICSGFAVVVFTKKRY